MRYNKQRPHYYYCNRWLSIDWTGWIVWWNVCRIGRSTDVRRAFSGCSRPVLFDCGARPHCHTRTPHAEIIVVSRIVLVMNAGASSLLANEACFLIVKWMLLLPPRLYHGEPKRSYSSPARVPVASAARFHRGTDPNTPPFLFH
jgi:hypothetical protein